MSATPLSPTLADAIGRYCAARDAVSALCAETSDEGFHRAPPDGGWSVAECIEHLLVSGGKMAAKLEPALAAARTAGRLATPAAARAPVRLGWFARFFVQSTGPGKPGRAAPARVRTRPPFDPGDPRARGRTRDAVGADFAALQERLIAIAGAADGLDLAGVKIESVLASWIRVPLGGWFLAIAGHQERHLDQARRALAAIAAAPEGAKA